MPTFNAAGPIVHGYGEAALPDGGEYKGEFADGLFNGKGVMTWANGSRYEGEFRNGLQHGKGEHISPNGDVYRGEFVEGSESGTGAVTFSNGDRYEGEFRDGAFHGKGTYTSGNGDVYTGDFQRGDFSGAGKLTAANGDVYEGEFDNWRFNGDGVLVMRSGEKYAGRFADSVPSGQMKVEYQGGARYEWGMEGWDYHGKGALTGSNGDSFSGRYEHGAATGVMDVVRKDPDEVYRGELEGWQYHGKGSLAKSDGLKYEGEFRYGLFDGKGALNTRDGRKYTGKFQYGSFHGEGTLEYRNAVGERKKLAGTWRNGKYAGDDADAYVKEGLAEVNAEKVLYEQPGKVEGALVRLAPQVAGQPDLYFVGFGSYGPEDVFMKEIRYSSSVMNKLYNVGMRSISMINNPKTIDEVPLATVTNLEAVLNGVAKQMDINEDILFLYVSSHGSREHEIAVSLDGVPLQDLTARKFKQIIESSGIKWKVLVVSACFSGGLIEPLKDEHTLVMTAARSDRESFGCGVNSELTYFGRAFFEQSLNPQVSFADAFAHARDLITGWEKAEKQEPSEPQIATSPLIEKKLAEWHDVQARKANLASIGTASSRKLPN